MKIGSWTRLCAGALIGCCTTSISAGQDSSPQREDAEQMVTLDEVLRELRDLEDNVADMEAASNRPSRHKVFVTGFGSTNFSDAEGAASSFGTELSPIFLWTIDDRFLFEAELEMVVTSGGGHGDGHGDASGEGETAIDLGYASASYIVNDYLTLGGGKFLTPFGIFMERIHPSWINKLPDSPLTVGHGGIVPPASVGVFARGGSEVGSGKLNYALYLSNGPRLNTGEEEEHEAGQLHFDNYTDVNSNKALGGRIGYLPNPALELGASFLTAGVTPRGEHLDDATANLIGVDLSYDRRWGRHQLSLRGEYAWSDVDDVVYDEDGDHGFGPLSFTNEREGGYLQLSDRLVRSDDVLLSPWEMVIRFDVLENPADAPETFDQERMTLGVNYWVGPTSVVKVAYVFDDVDGHDAEAQDMFLLQFAVGF